MLLKRPFNLPYKKFKAYSAGYKQKKHTLRCAFGVYCFVLNLSTSFRTRQVVHRVALGFAAFAVPSMLAKGCTGERMLFHCKKKPVIFRLSGNYD